MTQIPDERALDGNAAAGPFGAIFGGDLTSVVVTCAGCRASAPFAEQRAFLDSPGTVLRCPDCDHLLARVRARLGCDLGHVPSGARVSKKSRSIATRTVISGSTTWQISMSPLTVMSR